MHNGAWRLFVLLTEILNDIGDSRVLYFIFDVIAPFSAEYITGYHEYTLYT